MKLLSATTVITATCALFALPASAATVSAHIARLHTTTTTVSASPSRAFVHAPVKLSATVRSRVGTPTGSVVFTWNRIKLCTATLHHGSGSCTVRFSRARIYLVVGTYARNSRYFGSSGTVRVRIVNPPPPPPVPTTTTVTSPSSAFVDAAVRLSATVKSSGATATGTVTFASSGKTLCVAQLSSGSGSCTTTFGSVGTFTVTGTYGGDARHTGSSGSASVTVKLSPTTTTITNLSPGSVLAGNPFTVDVTVTSPAGTPTPTGTVVVAPTSPPGLPPSYSCTATLVAGKGSCQVTPGAGTFGDVFYEATYSGDATHTASVSTGMHELIVPETTTTSVSPATAAAGSVTLTATVIGQAMTNISPGAGGTGTVTFTITRGSTTVATCTKAPLTYMGAGANVATCGATLVTGSYAVTAVYSGDPNNLTSTGTETLTVS